MHEVLDEYNNLKSEITIEFKKAYNILLVNIKKYKFDENSKKGFATKQNKNSRAILSDLQILNSLLDDILKFIDDLFTKTNPNDFIELKETTTNELKSCINNIYFNCTLLSEAMYAYYDGNIIPDSKNSSARARNWKKERNNTLANILEISFHLLGLRNKIEVSCYGNYDYKINEDFKSFLDYLSSRPNYYSYMTTEMQNTEAKKNKSKKRILKETDRIKSKLHI